jgi:hypothetical protein
MEVGMNDYTRQLESLILETLLPAYLREQRNKRVLNPLESISPTLLNQIRQSKAKVLPALLRPKEKWACTNSSNSV